MFPQIDENIGIFAVVGFSNVKPRVEPNILLLKTARSIIILIIFNVEFD